MTKHVVQARAVALIIECSKTRVLVLVVRELTIVVRPSKLSLISIELTREPKIRSKRGIN